MDKAIAKEKLKIEEKEAEKLALNAISDETEVNPSHCVEEEKEESLLIKH